MSALPEWHIREARCEEVPAIAALTEEFAAYLSELGDTSAFRLGTEALARDGFGPDPAFRGLVAECSSEVVGFLLHHPGYDTDQACRLLFVVDLYVTAVERGRGIGAALMKEARKVARAGGAKQMVWTVYRHNALGRRFYEGIGARSVDDLNLMCWDVL
ncbi:gnat family acetyltransferase : GCN5-related N-acetyltransferase OS=Flavobacteria bacterium MS024-3C GN=Flav3CDRAFT_0240 PE=4 SV=1: Acetyltransf_1 [Gemmata massiliana]|uniref:N-acetyltransferase domain-containing protein n=1 Tax=Gemmata massiliana TaxID=1210884 RepID=A0A6P2CYN6_9BACT|nr:GNAT family N-acetyltransferase [Gemmata massiliana]VTR92904.1 gnat family acetyltransferase : GCN5-related N-acetyltransferase OS=Flavobacteria bacterium MS024-3C GN=Flav3CDRAFT_0240 PE=4 SV=1: Acetyltransf_1 [Gemmata massiliana]